MTNCLAEYIAMSTRGNLITSMPSTETMTASGAHTVGRGLETRHSPLRMCKLVMIGVVMLMMLAVTGASSVGDDCSSSAAVCNTAGQYCFDTVTCQLAQVGYYATENGLQTPCNAGTTTSATGSTSSAACNVCQTGYGRYTIGVKTNNNCALCAIGKYRSGTADADCMACKAGYSTSFDETASNHDAAADCSICAAGYSRTGDSIVANTSGCTACPLGTYNDYASSDATCSDAGSGQKTVNSDNIYATSGAVTVINCPAGTYDDGFAPLGNCVVCPTGKYQNVEGQTLCENCPDGTTTTGDSSANRHDSEGDCEDTYKVPTAAPTNRVAIKLVVPVKQRFGTDISADTFKTQASDAFKDGVVLGFNRKRKEEDESDMLTRENVVIDSVASVSVTRRLFSDMAAIADIAASPEYLRRRLASVLEVSYSLHADVVNPNIGGISSYVTNLLNNGDYTTGIATSLQTLGGEYLSLAVYPATVSAFKDWTFTNVDLSPTAAPAAAPADKKSHDGIYIGVGVGLFVLASAAAFYYYYYYYHRHSANAKQSVGVAPLPASGSASASAKLVPAAAAATASSSAGQKGTALRGAETVTVSEATPLTGGAK